MIIGFPLFVSSWPHCQVKFDISKGAYCVLKLINYS